MKTGNKRLLKLVETLLYARRSHNIKREVHAYETLLDYCQRQDNVEIDQAIEQGITFLKRTSISARMNGIV